MAISLYDISVLCYLQTLDAVAGYLDKGLVHFREHGIDPEHIVEARVHPDMLPFRFQVVSIAHHSAGTVAAFKSGVFRPGSRQLPHDYAALQTLIEEARTNLRQTTPEEINAHQGGEVRFEVADIRRDFTAENFVLSFSLPNFHFHAATAYGILRAKGVPLGKRDYMGPLRLKA